jgi:hypothetical protein
MKLYEYISLHHNKPFKWGENDCCTFAIGWLELVMGKDFLSEHRPWSSALEASRKVKDLGGLPLLLSNNLKQINANFAWDGDLAIYQDAAHLFSGSHIVSVGEKGLIFTDRMKVTEAYTCRQYSEQ